MEQLANPGYVRPASPNPQGSPYHRQRDWGPVVTKLVDTGYPMAAAGPVRYRPVWSGDMVIGFLWASEEENALGYVARREARAAGNRARGWWIKEAAELARHGLSATEALRVRVGLSEDAKGGRLDEADEERIARSTQELKEISYGPWPPEGQGG
ncbi:hypothetical protein [Nocardiopsis tropica]|uniref:Uncharacterized protein n=1 Tax=Nocardiopsis tropica TaxID=109330 RepID=A0ABU7KYI9_9ACTN|nr:hypothetical protein [Nocardiopsis umidischolae]MEE2054377.1 hypothetical protein [Nocardiopsis umidischolae]